MAAAQPHHVSQKSVWVSEDGNVYVIYTIKQMASTEAKGQ